MKVKHYYSIHVQIMCIMKYQREFIHSHQVGMIVNSPMRIAKTCEGCYRLRNGTCSTCQLPVVNFEPVGFKCPLNFNRPIPKFEPYKIKSVLLLYNYVRHFSIARIAREINTPDSTVRYWFKENKLILRSYNKLYGEFT